MSTVTKLLLQNRTSSTCRRGCRKSWIRE